MLIHKLWFSFKGYGWATENLSQTKSVLQAKEHLSSMNPGFLFLTFPFLLCCLWIQGELLYAFIESLFCAKHCASSYYIISAFQEPSVVGTSAFPIC